MITKITSKQNERIKYFNQLKDSSFRNKEKLFMVEGFHLVDMALEKGCVKTLISLSPYKAEFNDIEQIIVTEEILEKLSSTKTPQGIIAICKMDSFINEVLGDKEKAEKVKNLINSRRLFYPVGMLIAIIPDDLLTTLAGVAKMNFWYILIVSAITRALCVAYTVFGIGLLSSTWWGIMIFGVVTIGIMALGYIIIRYEPKIEDFFKRKFRK